MLSLSDIFAMFRWWVALLALGTAVTPLTFVLFRRLPDRGYAFTKMIGLLLVSYLFWILGSLGFLGNNLGGILFALAAVFAGSMWLLSQHRSAFRDWLGGNGRYILTTELIFLAVFIFWAIARAQHPEISATEKPMEFAFLNSAVRTPTFPPIDPWLSGFAISYYYFGYVMTSVITRLAVVPTAIGFNLALAWLAAGTAVGSFGLVYNLIASRGERFRRTAVLFGIVAAMAIPVVGNQEITLEVLYANNVGSDAFWQWLDVKDLNQPTPAAFSTPRYESSAWWWWRASRPINEYTLSGATTLEPIVEFPAFSFVLGDIHPHVLALPFALLSLALAYVWYLESRNLRFTIYDLRFWNRGSGIGDQGSELTIDNVDSKRFARQLTIDNSLSTYFPLYIFTVLLLGGLSFLNTWDVLIHAFVVLAAFALGQWQRRGVWRSEILTQTAVLALILLIPAFLLYFPFYIGFQSQAGAPYLLPMLMRPTRLPQFLIVFGMPLVVLVPFLFGLAVRQRFARWKLLVGTAVGIVITLMLLALLLSWIIAASNLGAATIISFANEVGVTLPPRPATSLAPGWGIRAVFAILPTYLLAKAQTPGTTLLLATMLGIVVMVWNFTFKQTASQPVSRSAGQPVSQSAGQFTIHNSQFTIHNSQFFTPSSTLVFTLLLILTATLLTIGPEFVYLRDNFGVRLNTIFKFYYQAWVMFGIAAVVALEMMWHEWRARTPTFAVGVAYAALFVLALQFPLYAVRSRSIEYRGPVDAAERLPATLDGLAKLQTFNPDEYAAIQWLAERYDEELPVVLEATGGAYSSYGRVAANTGLPTVLGWANHEYQWRGSDTPEPGARNPVIQQIYTEPFWNDTSQLLNQYDIEYIYVGPLEITTYGSNGQLPARDKFDDFLEVAYQNNSVTIYRWHPE